MSGYGRTVGFDAELGKLMAAWRREHGLTQERLGAAIGVDQTVISRLESGERRIDVHLLLTTLGALDLELADVAEEIASLVKEERPPSLWQR